MAKYSIRDLAQLSGIKAHTLRMWEQRYKFILPQRTCTNIRYYNDEDLRLLLNVAILQNKGCKIGNIAKLSSNEIGEQVKEILRCTSTTDCLINALTNAMIVFDEGQFEMWMSQAIERFGLETSMRQIIYPFLERIGVLWMTGTINPGQEHFISNLIRQKIIASIDKLGLPPCLPTSSKHFLLFLPEGELHEIGLLFLCYLLRTRHHRVTYLGCSVPLDDVVSVAQCVQPDYLYTIVTSSTIEDSMEKSMEQYIQQLAVRLPKQQLVFSGKQIEHLSHFNGVNVQVLSGMGEVLQWVEKIAPPVSTEATAAATGDKRPNLRQ